jgi:hypothetical protein
MKHQIPSSNIQRSSKRPSSKSLLLAIKLEDEAWNFSGAWMLVVEVF